MKNQIDVTANQVATILSGSDKTKWNAFRDLCLVHGINPAYKLVVAELKQLHKQTPSVFEKYDSKKGAGKTAGTMKSALLRAEKLGIHWSNMSKSEVERAAKAIETESPQGETESPQGETESPQENLAPVHLLPPPPKSKTEVLAELLASMTVDELLESELILALEMDKRNKAIIIDHEATA